MIEVVPSALTKGQIQRQYGGRTGAFKLDVLKKFLMESNRTRTAQESAINNFVRSCAGYSVATFVLGLADRHSDNIMLTTDGRLFHIDFGHFLVSQSPYGHHGTCI